MIIAKYKFNSSVYANLIPEFNSGFTGYTISDVTNGNIITRTIEHANTLPTNIKFGHYSGGLLNEQQAKSLISVDYVETSNLNETFTYCMFANCTNLTSLDLSNWNTGKVTDMSYIFSNTPLLMDIGMVYCDASTVNELSSSLNTQARNVYVECDISCYDKYQNITYIQYKEDKKSLLYFDNETNTWRKPIIREWDTIEKHSDGKYYYHVRSGEIVLNGSENWQLSSSDNYGDTTLGFQFNNDILPSGDLMSDNFISTIGASPLYNNRELEVILASFSKSTLFIRIKSSKLSTQDVNGFKQWLSENPTTVVYQLAEERVYECVNIDLISYLNSTNLEINSGVIIPKTTLR